jgi:TatD DNase family protein
MFLIDTHAHIYDEQFDQDRKEIILDAAQNGVQMILMPNCDSSTIDVMHQCATDFPGICIPMMGLHPCYVKDNYEDELALVQKYLTERKDYCAVGEIGLDYYWDKTHIEQQKLVLRAQIEMALAHQLPIVIHSRESTQDCIDIVAEYIPKGLTGVFHCYSGDVDQAKQLVDFGFYLGIGGVLTYKKSGLDLIVKEIPLENLILETDAPYLAPTPHRGKRNQPAFTRIVAEKLAEVKHLNCEEVAIRTAQNAHNLFLLNKKN